MVNILKIENLNFKDKEKNILNNISLEIKKGECISIVGESGGGKSTLLRLLADLISPTSGDIKYKESSYLSYNPIELRRKISYCTQLPYLFGGTVKDNLEFPFKIRNKKIDNKRVNELLDVFKLDTSYLSKDINLLSGGEKQRIALIRNLMFLPDVLLLDEATSALDKANTIIVEEYIKELNNSGITIVWVTHDEEQSTRIFNKKITMEEGKIKKTEVIER
ncbi:ATP-binding cassette domain-containing protein [uncultured Clostridium sp.]|uniref:ABC transporter ATP-binding protein n=1 Tax=uncultured Clostridium sp. TaxID=59620 RepID=UPI00258C05CC|nr:ATP-binding cassette domain-containing protein [uncultured Clostridium sp.]